MRKVVIGLALASTAMATPALARDDSWYIELDAGVMIPEDTDFAIIDDGEPTGDGGTVDWDYGTDFGGIVGYDFGMLRLEAEAAYKMANDDGADLTEDGESGTLDDSDIDIKFRTLSFMLNGLLDFGPDDGLQGFVGGGVGVARTKLKIADLDFSDSDTGFAWQALAGVRAPLSDNVDIGLKYRYFRHDDIKYEGGEVETDLATHSLMLTLGYNFGAPTPPPPPPPP
ncbi:outer membrane protein, partial [Croceicoccus bisphenolivorans]|uniref:outer membrane protein n=1 Tax=Croceicoccus bisphenolivorans TaxID=1783232 RepID=UPI0012E90EB6